MTEEEPTGEAAKESYKINFFGETPQKKGRHRIEMSEIKKGGTRRRKIKIRKSRGSKFRISRSRKSRIRKSRIRKSRIRRGRSMKGGCGTCVANVNSA